MIAALVLMLCSCGEESAESTPGTSGESTEPVCTYSYDHAQTTATWTAYKFTEKTGVAGKFDQLEINGINGQEDPLAVIVGAQFSATTSSVNTDNPERNGTISDNFFAALSSDKITGTINTMADGIGMMSIMMNGMQNDVAFTYTMEDLTFSLAAEINMDDWGCGEARMALNEVCHDLHIGADGESVLWPDVTLNVTSTLVKTCN